MRYFETHCHLDFANYKKDRDAVIKRCLKEGVEHFINVGIDEKTSAASVELAEKYPQFYAAAGYHPHEAAKFDEQKLLRFLTHPRIVALGEIGLDYYRNLCPKNTQLEVFETQIVIAMERQLPLIIHNREADEDCLKLLEKHSPEKVVFHCYSGDLSMAERIWEKGWNTSFTGAVTYPNNRMTDIIRLAPPDRIMIETDSPFLAPQAIRGKRNDPAMLRYVLEKISEIRREAPKQIGEAIFNNSCDFFIKKA
jgi:TatD DNase family protein